MMFDLNRVPFRNIDIMIIGVCNIIDGVIRIGSFGFVEMNVHFAYAGWRAIQYMRYLAKQEAKTRKV